LSLPHGNTTKLHTNVTVSWDDAGRTMNTNTPNGATAGVPGFNEYGYVGGTRVWKKITRNGSTFEHRVYVHAGPNLIAEYNAGAAASSPAQEYVYADQIDSLVMIHRSNGQRLGVTRNRQWSVTALHDLANGNVVERYAYDMTGKRTIYAANGTTVRTTSSFGNPFGYTNRWHDEESGLINFRARHYNPLMGEFLRRDPAGFVDGMSLYRGYFDLNGVDPTGEVARFVPIIGWFIVGAASELAWQWMFDDEINVPAVLAGGDLSAIPGPGWFSVGSKAFRIQSLKKQLAEAILEWRYNHKKILDGTSKMHWRADELLYWRNNVAELIRSIRETIRGFWGALRFAAGRKSADSITKRALEELTRDTAEPKKDPPPTIKWDPPSVSAVPIADGLGQGRFVLCVPETGEIYEVFPGQPLPPGTLVPPQWPGHPGHGPIYQPVPQVPGLPYGGGQPPSPGGVVGGPGLPPQAVPRR
jgi:RHS repeat-associated protein